MQRSQILVKVIDQTVIIEKNSAFKLSYSLTSEITITVNEEIGNQICGACGKFTESVSAGSVMLYMNENRAPDFPSW